MNTKSYVKTVQLFLDKLFSPYYYGDVPIGLEDSSEGSKEVVVNNGLYKFSAGSLKGFAGDSACGRNHWRHQETEDCRYQHSRSN